MKEETSRSAAELTLDHQIDLLWNSFDYSQGDPQLQLGIFDYLHLLHPEWLLDIKGAAALLPRIREMLEIFTKQDGPVVYHGAISTRDKYVMSGMEGICP